MSTAAAVQEWIQIHRTLIEKESAFTDLAIRAASGAASPEELHAEHEALMAVRQQCTAAYAKAFPKPATP